jgi:hypothetical protein
MRIHRSALSGAAVLLLAGCAGGTTGTQATAETSAPTTTGSSTAGASPSLPATPEVTTVSPSPQTPAKQTDCAAFGSTKDVTSADPATLSELTGETMRVGERDCYDRFVFQMQGSGVEPGWRVGYVDELLGQGSGDPVTLRGNATLEVLVGVWTVTDFPGREESWIPYEGPDQIITQGFTALKEARNLYAYEGQTQIGLGIDKKRSFRVQVLDGPERLVVDVATGVPAS